jgi:hypothetical protein
MRESRVVALVGQHLPCGITSGDEPEPEPATVPPPAPPPPPPSSGWLVSRSAENRGRVLRRRHRHRPQEEEGGTHRRLVGEGDGAATSTVDAPYLALVLEVACRL